tara:strand:+ start:103 stop:621 length:519 start_codon:yes stop_codon:yes gene_type:complete
MERWQRRAREVADDAQQLLERMKSQMDYQREINEELTRLLGSARYTVSQFAIQEKERAADDKAALNLGRALMWAGFAAIDNAHQRIGQRVVVDGRLGERIVDAKGRWKIIDRGRHYADLKGFGVGHRYGIAWMKGHNGPRVLVSFPTLDEANGYVQGLVRAADLASNSPYRE